MWKNDKANGWGVSHKKDDNNEGGPIILEGMFKADRLSGFGRMKVVKDDTLYEGQFYQGNKDGWGIILWPDNSVLEGNWTKGKINGVGLYKWSDGREYRGDWLDQKLHGIGLY
jgi:hypothetical protein